MEGLGPGDEDVEVGVEGVENTSTFDIDEAALRIAEQEDACAGADERGVDFELFCNYSFKTGEESAHSDEEHRRGSMDVFGGFPDSRASMNSMSSMCQSLDWEPKGEDILNAIPASVALMCLGRIFREAGGEAGQYKVSVPHIDEFWSYSRHAPVWSNVRMLLLYYHSRACTVAGFAAALAVIFALPAGNVSSGKAFGLAVLYAGVLATIVMMFTWQSRQRIFLDKACIAQDNEIEKRDGILSLGYFLKNSKTMIVLWDRTYFTRLWCVFEFAAFLKLRAIDQRTHLLRILPGSHASMSACVFLGAVVTATASSLRAMKDESQWSHESFRELLKELVFRTAVVVVFFGFLSKIIGNQIVAFASQRKQLMCFSTKDAGCYCCSVKHQHPETKEVMECDREMIENSVSEWFGSVDAFDTYVRHSVQMHLMVRPHLRYRYVLFSLMPLMWDALGTFTWLMRTGHTSLAMELLIYDALKTLLFTPVIWSLFWRIFGHCFSHCPTGCDFIRAQVISTVLVAILFFVISSILEVVPFLLGIYGYLVLTVVYGTLTIVEYKGQL